MIFNADHKVMQYCNGDVWVGMGGGGSVQRVSGEIAAFALSACPEGWSEYTLARGRFLRGIDNGAGNDPDGTRTAGATQGDAIRNITGSIVGVEGEGNKAYQWGFKPGTNGAFAVAQTHTNYNTYGGMYVPNGGNGHTAQFDASRVVPTAAENRPKNVAVLYCIKS